MWRTKLSKTVAAAVILAACGVAIGCRSWGTPANAAAAAQQAGEAITSGEAGVKTIAAETQVAQKQVQKAIPHSDVQGQAYLEAASDAHAVTLATTGQVENALDHARAQIEALRLQLLDLAAQVQEGQKELAELQARWFVIWGHRLERWLWTAAIVWLIGSLASLALGLGSPLGWFGRVRGILRMN